MPRSRISCLISGKYYGRFLGTVRKKAETLGEGMELRQGTGTVLVVDDEIMVMELARDILQRFGYRVLMAKSGEEAVGMYQQRSKEIAAVVLDMGMPGMDGREAFRGLRNINANAKVIISSGHNQDRDADELLKLGAAGFVQKPYRITELVKVVGEVVTEKQ
jgi:CheY-like chemotaxis protein